MTSTPLKVAVVGVGHLGQVHARIYAELPQADLVAVVDSDAARAQEIAARHGARAETDLDAVLDEVDAVSIATPTVTHFDIASTCIERGIPSLVEKPMTANTAQAETLVALARERGVPLGVGHVERFNPAFAAIAEHTRDVKFIEAHRLTPFSFRSTDIGVVLDLMIHDLDLILSVVDSEVASIQAAGVNIIHAEHEDLANARITFANGCVANVTASRISDRQMRKIRFFTPEAYTTLDLKTKEAWIYRKGDQFAEFDPATIDPAKLEDPMFFLFHGLLNVKKIDIDEADALRAELVDFLDAVKAGRDPSVSGEHGMRAIELASAVLAAMRDHRATYFPDVRT